MNFKSLISKPIYFLFLGLIACETVETKTDESIVKDSITTTPIEVKTEVDSAYLKAKARCDNYYNWNDSISKRALEYFNDSVFEDYINNKYIPNDNKLFLKELYSHINNTNTSPHILEGFILPIYTMKKHETGVIGNPVSDEIKYLKDNGLLIDNRHLGKVSYCYDSTLIKSFFTKTQSEFHLYASKKSKKVKLKNYCYMLGMCNEYAEYIIDQTDVSGVDSCLFGSKYKLDLEFEKNALVDSTLKHQYVKNCDDCVMKYEQEVSFARLKGIPNIYFVFADTFPINDKYDYPKRSIVIQLPTGEVVTLWHDAVDSFGCSCL